MAVSPARVIHIIYFPLYLLCHIPHIAILIRQDCYKYVFFRIIVKSGGNTVILPVFIDTERLFPIRQEKKFKRIPVSFILIRESPSIRRSHRRKTVNVFLISDHFSVFIVQIHIMFPSRLLFFYLSVPYFVLPYHIISCSKYIIVPKIKKTIAVSAIAFWMKRRTTHSVDNRIFPTILPS